MSLLYSYCLPILFFSDYSFNPNNLKNNVDIGTGIVLRNECSVWKIASLCFYVSLQDDCWKFLGYIKKGKVVTFGHPIFSLEIVTLNTMESFFF